MALTSNWGIFIRHFWGEYVRHRHSIHNWNFPAQNAPRFRVQANAHAGGIDHHQFTVEAGRNLRQKPILDPGFAPANEPVVASGWWAIPIRDLSPRRAGSEPPKIGVQHLTIISPCHAPRLVRKQRLDNLPLSICQFAPSSRHQVLHMRDLESATLCSGALFYEFTP